MTQKLSFFHRGQQNSTGHNRSPSVPQRVGSEPAIFTQSTIGINVPPSPLHVVSRQNQREKQFETLLQAPVVDIHRIRELSWAGVPTKLRAQTWKLFLDYMPVNAAIRQSTLDHKRSDYYDCVNRVFAESQRYLWTSAQKEIDSQIMRDLPRSKHPLLRLPRVQQLFERILFVWAVRHPASGYVQGMNDILQPFFLVFLAPYTWNRCQNSQNAQNSTVIPQNSPGEETCLDFRNTSNSENSTNLVGDPQNSPTSPNTSLFEQESINANGPTAGDLVKVTDEELRIVEADCFWCFSKLLDGLQDLYTKDQPGLYKVMTDLAQVMERVDPALASWIAREDIQYQEFAFRWINCLLVREFSPALIFRLWDSYLSNHAKIATTHLYTCAAFLETLSTKIINQPHPEFILTIQSMDPDSWTQEDMEEIIAQAYVYYKMFSDSPSHLRSSSVPIFLLK